MLLDSICANLVSWLMPGSTTRSFFWSSSVCWVLPLRTSSFVFSRQEGPDECILLRSVFDCVKIPWCLKSTMGMYRDYSLQQVYFKTSWFSILGDSLIIRKLSWKSRFTTHQSIQNLTSRHVKTPLVLLQVNPWHNRWRMQLFVPLRHMSWGGDVYWWTATTSPIWRCVSYMPWQYRYFFTKWK